MKQDCKSDGDFIIENGVLKEYLGTNTSVIIPENVKKIDNHSFRKINNLKAVHIPQSVIEIDWGTFYGQTSLSEIYYAGTIEQWKNVIKPYNWRKYTPAKDIKCTDGVLLLPEFDIFHGVLRNYYGTNPSVIIPENVRKIAPCGFSNCETLKSVTITKELTEIDYSAFSGCTSLSEINYTGTKEQWKSVKKGMDWRRYTSAKFVRCSDGNTELSQFDINDGILEAYFGIDSNVIIPENVQRIGTSSFRNCESLKSIVIPENVMEIDSFAFNDCTSLSEIHYNDTKKQWLAMEKYPDWRRYIPAEFVQCTDGNIELPQFEIKDGILQRYCGINPSVIIPDNVTKIGESAFKLCRLLKSITIPESVTEICENAFRKCISLETINIPNSITKIHAYAFYCCTSLKSVNIPISVREIDEVAFFDCRHLSEINYAGTKEQWKAVKKGFDWRRYTSAKFVQCTDGIIKHPKFCIKNGVLQKYFGTDRTLVIPDSVIKIGENVFKGNCTLVSVSLPNGVKEIGDYAFSKFSTLESINIPDSVTSIGERAFEWNQSLTSIKIPSSVREIGKSAFSNCESLVSVSLSNVVKTIGDYAFRQCSNLESINIPDSVTSIGDGAFQDCDSLESVYIPACVKKFGEGIFEGCTSLKENPLQSKLE